MILPMTGILNDLREAVRKIEAGQLPGITLIVYEPDGRPIASHAIPRHVPWKCVADALRSLASEVDTFPEHPFILVPPKGN